MLAVIADAITLARRKAASRACVRDDALLVAMVLDGIRGKGLSVDTRKEVGVNLRAYGRVVATLA
jgi:hypothetical protein